MATFTKDQLVMRQNQMQVRMFNLREKELQNRISQLKTSLELAKEELLQLQAMKENYTEMSQLDKHGYPQDMQLRRRHIPPPPAGGPPPRPAVPAPPPKPIRRLTKPKPPVDIDVEGSKEDVLYAVRLFKKNIKGKVEKTKKSTRRRFYELGRHMKSWDYAAYKVRRSANWKIEKFHNKLGTMYEKERRRSIAAQRKRGQEELARRTPPRTQPPIGHRRMPLPGVEDECASS